MKSSKVACILNLSPTNETMDPGEQRQNQVLASPVGYPMETILNTYHDEGIQRCLMKRGHDSQDKLSASTSTP